MKANKTMRKDTKPRSIKKILLIQPNYAWLNKRTWPFPPYTLCLLKASLSVLGRSFQVTVFDPNLNNLSEKDVSEFLRNMKPDLVGITSVSTEYFDSTKLLTSLTRKALPESIIVLGGVIPTVLLEESMKDENVDYWLAGEGERTFPEFIKRLVKGQDVGDIEGLAFWKDGKSVKNKPRFIEDLDNLPLPDYTGIVAGKDGSTVSILEYGKQKIKYTAPMLARQFPFAVTISSRGCPYRCIFCAGKTVSGSKVRFRSAQNMLAEIDWLYKMGVREIIFLDDHFLADRKRAIAIMEGIKKAGYGITWKCVNVTAWLLDEELLKLMRESGCDLIVVSIESGNRHVLKDIIKKPVDLEKVPGILKLAKSMGFYIQANFVIGFPQETWTEIRDTFRYAQDLDADLINFHIATPLPKTELMEICLKQGLLPKDYFENAAGYSGYGRGLIATKEFTPFELQVLRSFEWDRINFATEARRRNVAWLNGITLEELEDWRTNTRRNLGVNSLIKNLLHDKSEKE